MSINNYAYFQQLYASIKPIRGRAEEVRPIGKRNRDWEQITRTLQADGAYSYKARLYQTDVVEYFANGDVVLRAGGWQTPTTADFIYTHSPFGCRKQYGKLWAFVKDADVMTAYPIGDALHLKQVGEHQYEPVTPVVLLQRRTDRDKAKAGREPLKPFMSWARMFLKMSDGWVMYQTRREVVSASYVRRPKMADIYELLTRQADVEQETIYLQALSMLTEADEMPYEDRRLITPAAVPWGYDYRIAFEDLRNVLHKYVRKMDDAAMFVEVMPGPLPLNGVV